MATRSTTEARRAQIVDAMLRVMGERGYERASVAAIAEVAGLTSGLVHYHFRSKEAVLLALLERLEEIVATRFERFSREAATPRRRLVAFLDAHLARDEEARPDAVACWVALGTEALTRDEVRAAYRTLVEREIATLTDLVAAVLADEGGDVARAPALAAGLYAAIEGAFRLSAIAPGVIPAGSAASTLRAMTIGLLGPEED
ncbi:MAG: TetR family transcriptional regulator [Myxococcales bacterium]|nr:TetR family transcriptional regulator [Myxococcales bacterium]